MKRFSFRKRAIVLPPKAQRLRAMEAPGATASFEGTPLPAEHTLDQDWISASVNDKTHPVIRLHSTVTLFAKFRGWSTSVPFSTAV